MPTPIQTASKLTLLGLMGQTCNEIGLLAPSTIFGNTDNQVIQFLALAQREGKEFSSMANKNGGWEEMRQQKKFVTAGVGNLTGNTTISSAIITNITSTTGIVAGMVATGTGIPSESLVLSVDSATQVTLDTSAMATGTGIGLSFGTQSYSLPIDFQYFMTQTFWDRNYRWQLMGPLDAQEWQVLKSGIAPTGPRRRFRIMGNLFYIDPVPAEVTTIAYEYYSNAWCQSSTGTLQSKWAADTDYYTLDDDCFILGLKWRFLRAKGFDYQEEADMWMKACQRALARNGGNRNLPLNAQSMENRLLNYNNIPDTSYGS